MAGFRSFFEQQVERAWYGDARWSRALLPLVPLYRRAALKEKLRGQISAENNPLNIPVVVVGNITAGGTGKSPVVISLVRELQKRGYSPGILSRGYGGQADDQSRLVSKDDTAAAVGDEPLMMASTLVDVPVVVDQDRRRGAEFLQSSCSVDLVICDDGLQHYNLPRDIEIVVLDADRGVGNGLLIPAGPLRESVDRLQSTSFVLANGTKSKLAESLQVEINYEFSVKPVAWSILKSGEKFGIDHMPISGKVLAVSAIGNPDRFHRSLQGLGLQPMAKVFSDHHSYAVADFHFDAIESSLPLVMTAKDAVKCKGICMQLDKPNWWVLEVDADLPEAFVNQLASQLEILKTKEN